MFAGKVRNNRQRYNDRGHIGFLTIIPVVISVSSSRKSTFTFLKGTYEVFSYSV